MLNAARILDRGRLLFGLLLVVPIGVIVSVPRGSTAATPQGQWVAHYDHSAALDNVVDAQEILAQLTPSGGAVAAAPAAGTAGAASATPVSAPLVEEGGEGEVTTELPADYVSGAPPTADLAAVLRQSEQRNTASRRPANPSGTAAALAANPVIRFTRASQVGDLLSGQMDPRLVDVLTWITTRTQSITITSMKTDHSTCVAGSSPCRVSAHKLGRAFDIAAVNGQACTGVPSGECGRLYEEIVNTLRGTRHQPSQVIYGYDPWPTERWNFEMGNHHDHIHVGF